MNDADAQRCANCSGKLVDAATPTPPEQGECEALRRAVLDAVGRENDAHALHVGARSSETLGAWARARGDTIDALDALLARVAPQANVRDVVFFAVERAVQACSGQVAADVPPEAWVVDYAGIVNAAQHRFRATPPAAETPKAFLPPSECAHTRIDRVPPVTEDDKRAPWQCAGCGLGFVPYPPPAAETGEPCPRCDGRAWKCPACVTDAETGEPVTLRSLWGASPGLRERSLDEAAAPAPREVSEADLLVADVLSGAIKSVAHEANFFVVRSPLVHGGVGGGTTFTDADLFAAWRRAREFRPMQSRAALSAETGTP